MQENIPKIQLPPIPAKRYFTIGEMGELCGVKPHVLRYWEQEFTQLKPLKRRGNRRYYQHHEVILIRRIRELLYEEGFTISGARLRLEESSSHQLSATKDSVTSNLVMSSVDSPSQLSSLSLSYDFVQLRAELTSILSILKPTL